MSESSGRPSLTTLIDWIEGRLDDVEAARVGREVRRGDRTLAAEVAWLEGFRRTAAVLPLQDPPPLVRQRLGQHFERWARSQTIQDQPDHELEALLVFDSRQDLIGAGARGGADTAEVAHLAFSAGPVDLLLDIRYLGHGRVRIDGQALPHDPSSAPVFEASAEGPAFKQRTVDGDQLGRFTFADVPESVTRLRASNGQITVLAALKLERGEV